MLFFNIILQFQLNKRTVFIIFYQELVHKNRGKMIKNQLKGHQNSQKQLVQRVSLSQENMDHYQNIKRKKKEEKSINKHLFLGSTSRPQYSSQSISSNDTEKSGFRKIGSDSNQLYCALCKQYYFASQLSKHREMHNKHQKSKKSIYLKRERKLERNKNIFYNSSSESEISQSNAISIEKNTEPSKLPIKKIRTQLDLNKQSNDYGIARNKTPLLGKGRTLVLKNKSLSKTPSYQTKTQNTSDGRTVKLYKKDIDTRKDKNFWIRKNIIGFNTRYVSPLGIQVEGVYIDHTATNRPFQPVEDTINYAKLQVANPHTEYSEFGSYSTKMMKYSHDSLLKSFSASPRQYVALPAGNGSTGAIQKTVKLITSGSQGNDWKTAQVFITPYQHHSNILPWVQFFRQPKTLPCDQNYGIIYEQMFQMIKKSKDQYIIVSASAASNVTSKISNIQLLNHTIKILRRDSNKRIILCLDCAAFCCHHEMNLKKYTQVDFLYLSPHKNLGGSESCGVLIARRYLIQLQKPSFPGGGTVKFVKGYKKDEDILYSKQIFQKQIPGTPAFLGFYRAALSFQLLKQLIGYKFIEKRERKNTELFFQLIDAGNFQLKQLKLQVYIKIFGEKDLEKRANVVTLNILVGHKQIDCDFVGLVLSDVFGIQVRTGCFCAGPYGLLLLNLNQEKSRLIKDQVQKGQMNNKPGFVRFDLTFYLQSYEIEYIANSLLLVAKYWQSYQNLYEIIVKNGAIQYKPKIKISQQKMYKYNLHNFKQFQEVVNNNKASNFEKLKMRRKTLAKQLKIGQRIGKQQNFKF